MNYIITILAASCLMVLMILLASAKPRVSKLVTFCALAFTVVGGLLIYGYGYTVASDNIPLAILRATLAVCGAFVGADDYSAIPEVPGLQTIPMQLLCIFIRVCALYVTASTVINTIGARALRRLRLLTAPAEPLNLIFGTAPDAPGFASRLMEEKQGAVVFVSEQPDENFAAAVARAGGVLRTDTSALSPDKRFTRSIRLCRRRRKITLYALDSDTSANILYAQQLLQALEEKKVAPSNLHLVIFAPESAAVVALQASDDHYGFGFVSAVTTPQLSARLLTLKYPPCDTITFDENSRATEDFEALVIGFGQIGQAVLKSLIMNGQFEGSNFRAAVFSPDCNHADGSFVDRFSQLFAQYTIEFHDADARSRKLYDYLKSRGNKLKYVAICTGSHKQNREIGEAITAHFQNAGLSVPVYICAHNGVQACMEDGTVKCHPLFSTEVLCTHALDSMAMRLNHRYHSPTDRTALECWISCDYFSRQSCRASADFFPAMIRAAGEAPENWNLTEAQLDTLSKTEHLRWCAFHYCMGFAPMSDEEFAARAETYLQQKAAGQQPLRIGKNMVGRTHACLVTWDELDVLSLKEEKVTGKYVDYKIMDTDNILMIPELWQQDL